MTKREKRRQKIARNPKNVSFEDLRLLLEDYGFELRRTRGSHYSFVCYCNQRERNCISYSVQSTFKTNLSESRNLSMGLKNYPLSLNPFPHFMEKGTSCTVVTPSPCNGEGAGGED